MKQNLDALTKEDWDTLFPIELVPHNPGWTDIFKAERQRISEKLGNEIALRIEHFGSTSIPNICAKAYIDIMIEIPKVLLFDEGVIEGLGGLGYHYFRQTGKVADYMIFVKGYHLKGENGQIFHIHMCSGENEMWDQISFRDYLISHPDRAKAYEELKVKLASRHKNDRSGYRIAKSDFINETVKRAKERPANNN